MTTSPLVKICGLCRAVDARVADDLGADFLGVVVSEGFGRSLRLDAAVEVLDGVAATRVAVLVDEPPERALEVAEAVCAGVIQLHGSESPEHARMLGERGPWRVWKAVRARGPGDVIRAADRYAGVVDGLVLEGWKSGVIGGGGARLDPEVFARERQQIPGRLDVILAGGLTPTSVADAVAQFSPHVVDVSSGVEARMGEKDHGLMRRFVAEARGTSHDASPTREAGR